MATKDDNSHILALQQLCRVCGDKVKPAKKRHTVYSCKNHPIDLLNTFDIDVQQDQVSIHPQYFCQACKGAIYHHKTNGVVLRSVTTWKHHVYESSYMLYIATHYYASHCATNTVTLSRSCLGYMHYAYVSKWSQLATACMCVMS